MTLRFDFFYENADKEYFLALLQKLAIACDVDLRAESNAEFLSIFASAESGEILGKFADILQAEVPHSLYFKLKEVNLCKQARGEKIAISAQDNIFSVSDINAIKDIKSPRFCEIYVDSAKLKSTLQNLCDALAKGQSVAFSTSRGEILLSTKSDDFDFILANDIATLNLYTRASQDEISALASFEKPLIELAIKEVFTREVGAKSAKFILPYDIILCCLSSMLLEKDIAFLCAKIAESTLKSSAFFEIVVGQNGYFLHKNYMDCANFAEFLNINFGAQSSAKIAESCADSANIIIYLSLQNPSIFACAGRKIANIAFDKNPKNILQKISTLENGDKLIANFKKAFEARYEAILALDSAPQWTQNLLDIFECAAMILGAESKNAESSKNEILNLAKEYLRDIGPKIDFKSCNASFPRDARIAKNVADSATRVKNAESTPDSADSQNLVKNQSREAQPLASSGEGEGVVREGEGSDFAIQASAPSLKENARGKKGESKADLSAQVRGENRVSLVVALPYNNKQGAENDNLKDSAETPQDAPKSKLQTNDLIYDELRTIRSIISFTLAGTEREVVAFGILESLADYLVLLFREAQNQFGAKHIAIAGDLFANKVFFDKITKKIPTNFKLIFPKYLDISSARRASCKT